MLKQVDLLKLCVGNKWAGCKHKTKLITLQSFSVLIDGARELPALTSTSFQLGGAAGRSCGFPTIKQKDKTGRNECWKHETITQCIQGNPQTNENYYCSHRMSDSWTQSHWYHISVNRFSTFMRSLRLRSSIPWVTSMVLCIHSQWNCFVICNLLYTRGNCKQLKLPDLFSVFRIIGSAGLRTGSTSLIILLHLVSLVRTIIDRIQYRVSSKLHSCNCLNE